MKNKKTGFLILAAVFVIVLLVSSVLYQKFSEKTQADGLMEQNKTGEQSAEVSDEQPEEDEEKKPIEAPDFTVYDKDGNEVSLSDYKGKYVVLNFWASWCGPCKSEMPAFDEVIQQYQDNEDIVFLMVNATDGQQETKEKALALLEENNWKMDILFDTDQSAVYAYNIYGFPTTVLIDKEGYLLAMQPSAISKEILLKVVETLLADQWERPLA